MRSGWLLMTCLAVGCTPNQTRQPTAGLASGVAALRTADRPAPAITRALSSAHTQAVATLENLPQLVQRIDATVAGLPAAVTASLPPLLRDPAARKALIGFDASTAAGWTGAGVDPAQGIGVVFDSRVDGPILFGRLENPKTLIATLERAGVAIKLGEPARGVLPITVAGEPFVIIERDGVTFVARGADPSQHAALWRLTDAGPRLDADPVFKRALADRQAGPWLTVYTPSAPVAARLKGQATPLAQMLTFYASRFQALALTMGRDGTRLRLLGDAATGKALQQIFRPATPAPDFTAHLRTGQTLYRADLDLVNLFDGALALMPESMAQQRSMVLMGKNALPMMLGVTHEQLASALSGHFAGVAGAGADALPVLMAGVKDGAALNALLDAFGKHLTAQGGGGLTAATIGGRPGFTVTGTDVVLARTERLLVVGPRAAVEATLAAKGDLSPTLKAAVQRPIAFGTVAPVDALIEQSAAAMAPADRAALTRMIQTVWQARLVEGHYVGGVNVDDRGLIFEDDATSIAVLGMAAAVAIPAFMRYQRRSRTLEATMNLRKLFDASIAYYLDERADAQGTLLPKRFPASAPLTPPTTACKGGSTALHVPDAKTWSHPTWQALGFAIDQPFLYQYEYISDGKTFTLRAHGDLNCDGVVSTFERVGRVTPEGEVVSDGPLRKIRPLE